MIFKKVEPHADMDTLCYRSESGNWEVGVLRVMYGFRVVVSDVLMHSYEINYCIGREVFMMSFTLHCLMKALQEMEDNRESVIAFCRSLPEQKRKPMQFGDDVFDALHTKVIDSENWGLGND